MKSSEIDCSRVVQLVQIIEKDKDGKRISWRDCYALRGEVPDTYHLKTGYNEFEDDAVTMPEHFEVDDDQPSLERIHKCVCNPARQVLTDDNAFYTDIKARFGDCNTYYTHDNGGRPFLVYVADDGDSVGIFRTPGNDDPYYVPDSVSFDKENHAWTYIYPVKVYTDVKRVMIGESTENRMTSCSGGAGDWALGNSVLLELNTLNHYVHIGMEVVEFTTDSEIIEFCSPVGNSNVPYPFAFDSEDNVYYFLDCKYVSTANEGDSFDRANAYDYWYGHNGCKFKQRDSKVFNNLCVVQKRLI